MYSRRLRDEHAAHKHELDVLRQSRAPVAGYGEAISEQIIYDNTDHSQLEYAGSRDSMEPLDLMPTDEGEQEEDWPFPRSYRAQEVPQTLFADHHDFSSRPTSSILTQPDRLDGATEGRERTTTPRKKLKKKSASISRPPLIVNEQAPPVHLTEDSVNGECLALDRRELRCLLSSSDYDYDSLAPIKFSWRPIPYKRPGRQQQTDINTPFLPRDQDLGLADDVAHIINSSEDDSGTTLEIRPFWDINDNLTGRLENAIDTASPADYIDEPPSESYDSSSKDSPRTPRTRNPCYAKKTRKALRSCSRTRPLTPVNELSEPESDSGSSEDEIDIEIGVAKRMSVTSIELSTQKAWELRGMRCEEIVGARVTDADGNGVERVDSVVEREREWECERDDEKMTAGDRRAERMWSWI